MVWDQPDEGIWEARGGRRHFILLQGHGLGGDRPRHAQRRTRSRARRPARSLAGICEPHARDICARASTTRNRASCRATAATTSTRALLLIPLVGFLPRHRHAGAQAHSPRSSATCWHDGFVRRYDTEQVTDGLPPGEGTFLACSFWLADNYGACKAASQKPAPCSTGSPALAQRRRPAGRGIRPRHQPPARQFPAGLLPPRTDRYSPEFVRPGTGASSRTRRAPRRRGR